MSHTGQVEVARDYTKARKFPQLIGRTPDGMRIPGGPYTIVEAVGVGLTLFIGYQTMGLWARFGFLGNLLVLGTMTVGVWFGLHRIPLGSRPPTSVAAGALNSVTRPRNGMVAGKPVRLRRPKVAHSAFVYVDELPTAELKGADAVAVAVELPAVEQASRRGPRVRGRSAKRELNVGLDVLGSGDPGLVADSPVAPMSTVQRLLAGQAVGNV